MGLYVGIFCAKKLANALDGYIFNLVHHLASSVITFAGVAFGIFVGKYAAHGLHHLVRNEVFGCN